MSDPVRLPILQQVEFRAFSLYSNHPTQTVPVHEGVFCLAGANGLGKSTFLNAVGFGLTGVKLAGGRRRSHHAKARD